MKIKNGTNKGYIEVSKGGGTQLFIPCKRETERQSD